MKFYVIKIQELKDDKSAKAIYEYDDINQALMVLHQNMASSIASDNVKNVVVLIMNSGGAVQRIERWERAEEPVEEVPEETEEETEEEPDEVVEE